MEHIETEGDGQRGHQRRAPLVRFARDRAGTTAIEFAVLILPFSLLVFAILEVCLVFAAQELLANATDDVARQLRTGRIKASETDETKIRSLLCERLELLVAKGCPGLEFDLRQYATFEEAANMRVGYKADGKLDTGFDPGPALTKNMLHTFYHWPVLTYLMQNLHSDPNDNTTLLFATTAWQNEPFDD